MSKHDSISDLLISHGWVIYSDDKGSYFSKDGKNIRPEDWEGHDVSTFAEKARQLGWIQVTADSQLEQLPSTFAESFVKSLVWLQAPRPNQQEQEEILSILAKRVRQRIEVAVNGVEYQQVETEPGNQQYTLSGTTLQLGLPEPQEQKPGWWETAVEAVFGGKSIASLLLPPQNLPLENLMAATEPDPGWEGIEPRQHAAEKMPDGTIRLLLPRGASKGHLV